MSEINVGPGNYGDWTRGSDGMWRHPRYPTGPTERQHPGVKLEYDEATNNGFLTVNGEQVRLTLAEIRTLLTQARDVMGSCQEENARLFAEKDYIMTREEPAYAQRQRERRGKIPHSRVVPKQRGQGVRFVSRDDA